LANVHINIDVMHDAHAFTSPHAGAGPRWRTLRQFEIDGEQVVGVEEGEAFAIQIIHNIANTSRSRELVEARISIDGTDVLTGEKAGLGVEGKRWLMSTDRTLSLEAWPQTERGGARFVFSSPENAVAAHTHGDTSHVGIIGVALFVEQGSLASSLRPMSVLRGATRSGHDIAGPDFTLHSFGGGGASSNFEPPQRKGGGPAAAGAGEFTEQQLQTVAGLQSPRLHSISHVRYMWWDDLRALLGRERAPARTPGFPAGQPTFTGINLGSTPQVASTVAISSSMRFAP
jgi:hypothetical protein